MTTTDWRKKALALAEFFPDAPFREIAELAAGTAPLAVACSGGADSLATTLLTWAKIPAARERLVVLHFDHAVRAESAADADFVREVAAALGVGFACGKRGNASRDSAENFPASENALRKIRLEFFAQEMNARGAKILVQGHQRDDIAETLLMRLARGAGTDGLAAPRKISRLADGRIFVRPLLDFPKEKILAALRACGVSWREDSTNAGTEFFRNRVRNRVLPELRAAAPFENFARSRRLAEEDADALDFLAEKIFAAVPAGTSSAKGISFREIFAASGNGALPIFPALARRVLRKIFTHEKIRTSGAAVVDALVSAICAGTPLKICIGAREIVWTGTRLRIGREPAGTPPFSWSAEKVEITDALFEKICAGAFPPTETVFLAGTPEIFVRALLPGEKFRPLGAPGEKLVARIFTDKKIPRAERSRLPVFADGTGTAWIPGLPPAERFRIFAPGGTALRLTYRREPLPL